MKEREIFVIALFTFGYTLNVIISYLKTCENMI